MKTEQSTSMKQSIDEADDKRRRCSDERRRGRQTMNVDEVAEGRQRDDAPRADEADERR